ncbi:MAG: hypothetical protein ACFFDH_18780 [Promethearchaeota archaeon]
MKLRGWFLFPYIICAYVAEDDEKNTGKLKAGIYTGFLNTILNIFQAGGAFFIGAILSLPEISSTETFSYSMGLALFGPIVSVILLISYFFTKKFIKLDFDWEKIVKKNFFLKSSIFLKDLINSQLVRFIIQTLIK